MVTVTSQPAPMASFDQIRRVSGFNRIQSEYPAYLSDESKLTAGRIEELFFPADEGELAALLREMANRRMNVTIAGARTGLVGGCVPQHGALVSLENFDRVQGLHYDTGKAEWHVCCQCALSLRSLNTQLAARQFPDLKQCGDRTTLKALENFVRQDGDFLYAPDPTEMSASIGGTVATNASGARTYRYGPTREWVRAMRVMLPSGEVISITRGEHIAPSGGEFQIEDSGGGVRTIQLPTYQMPPTKNTAGFYSASQIDLIDLFIGSEGSFGVITEVTVALIARTEKISVVLFLDSDSQAINLVKAFRSDARIELDFLEFYSATALELLRERQEQDPKSLDLPAIPKAAGAALFFEYGFDALAPAPEGSALLETIKNSGAGVADSWAAYESREIERLKNFRHILPETINAIIADRKKRIPQLHKLGTDLAVPDDGLVAMWQYYVDSLEGAGLQWAAFGHIGDNHIHVNILPRDEAELEHGLALYERFAGKAVALGGTVSAEHGIGKIKKKYLKLLYKRDQIEQMVSLKRAFDPGGLLNDGNIF